MRQFVRSIVRITKTQTKFLVAIVIALVVGGVGSAVVFASIPDGSGVIHGCYNTGLLGNGQLRIIDSATKTCNGNETALNWNQTGPQGPQGEQGPVGPQGPAGSSDQVGKRLVLNWGDIPSGGTPQALTTIPDFGDLTVTQCDASGNTDFTFTNTSGQTVYVTDGASESTISSGTTVPGNDVASHTLATGSGPSSHTTIFAVYPLVSSTAQTCTFYAFGL